MEPPIQSLLFLFGCSLMQLRVFHSSKYHLLLGNAVRIPQSLPGRKTCQIRAESTCSVTQKVVFTSLAFSSGLNPSMEEVRVPSAFPKCILPGLFIIYLDGWPVFASEKRLLNKSFYLSSFLEVYHTGCFAGTKSY